MGEDNFHSLISFKKTLPLGSSGLAGICDYILWYGKSIDKMKYRELRLPKDIGAGTGYTWLREKNLFERKMSSLERNDPSVIDDKARPFFPATLSSSGYTSTCMYDFNFNSKYYKCGKKAGEHILLEWKD